MSAEIENWAKKYEELTNSDDTIGAMAKYYTCSFMFDMEKAKVIIEMHDGKVKKINTNPAPLDPYDFALRASAQTWRGVWSANAQTYVSWNLVCKFSKRFKD